MARLSTHVLDVSRGAPAAGLRIELFRITSDRLERVCSVITNRDGRTDEPLLSGDLLPGGVFELVFHAAEYFRSLGTPLADPPFLDRVAIRFGIDPAAGSYHVPLLLAPYSYSTYRGSLMRAHEIIDRCRVLAAFSETRDGLLRTFLSPPMREVHRLLRQWMEAAGMHVRIDAAGNVRGLYVGGERRLLLGSHVDTVPNAGAFDGVLGVVVAIGLVDALGGRRLPFSIEVVAFSEEEGVRFSVPFIGSRALACTLDAELLSRRDADGISVEETIRQFGLDPAELPEARMDERTFAYIEFHIEQGPVLESLGLPLGVVTSIAGQSRFAIRFIGQANHAGTTPMHLRRDALGAAARWISVVERHARATPGLVATVGAVEVQPGAANIIPGEVRASLDVRHAEDAVRHLSTAALLDAAGRLGARRGIAVDWQQRLDEGSTACDPCLVAAMSRAVAAAGFPVHEIVSGAGHDAMILAERVPVAMLFLRSPGGISHHPDESVNAADIEAALATGAALLAELEQTHA